MEIALTNKYLISTIIENDYLKGKFVEYINLNHQDYLSTLGLFNIIEIEVSKDSMKFTDDVESIETINTKSFLLFKLLNSFAIYCFANAKIIPKEINIMAETIPTQSIREIVDIAISCYIHNLIIVNNKKSEFIKFMNSDNFQDFRNRHGFNEIKNINLLNDGFENTFYIEDYNGVSKSFLTAQYEIVAIFKGFANVICGSEICSA